MTTRFILGVHEPAWLERTDVPLFVSARRLRRRKRLPRPLGTWALDSGGFSELSMFGEWRTSAMTYVSEVRYWRDEMGGLEWAAAQDWMCEPFILDKTGKTIREHQRLTVDNYLLLRQLAPDLPWLPVLQGFTYSDYLRHFELYYNRGVWLTQLPLVGLGSICRRQHTEEAERIIRGLTSLGLRLHGFGFKLNGLRNVSGVLASADSMAWSFDARRGEPFPGCTHATCANCLPYALAWRQRVLDLVERSRSRPVQDYLFPLKVAREMG